LLAFLLITFFLTDWLIFGYIS